MTRQSTFHAVFCPLTLAALALVGCTTPDGSRLDGESTSEASTDAETSTSEASTSETSLTTMAMPDMGEGETETTGGSSCPMPDAEPMIVANPEVFCSAGFAWDAVYDLCASETEAIGPFPPAMVEACLACGGVDCDASRWPVDQARGLRGTDPCWPGTSEYEFICVDDTHAWGPFSPSMVAGCKDAGGGEVTCESMRWARELAENLLPPKLGLDWVWIMPVDYGLRDDASGGGAFSAPRLNNPGGHSGIDVLAPVGTPLLAPCDGPTLVGYDGGYGNYVQLSCELPSVIGGGESLWVSILFAHLDTLSVGSEQVLAGDMLGTVGKTGNAAGQGINPHVHFEMAIHASLAAAQAESHASSDHSGNAAGDLFADLFASECLDVLEFVSLDGITMKGRRPDPFMLMSCLSADKPTLQQPGPGLQSGQTPWSDHYDAGAFDVNVGL
jgi:murein DD-endopeptidase MepM/ murein hydrolase activator NlpD